MPNVPATPAGPSWQSDWQDGHVIFSGWSCNSVYMIFDFFKIIFNFGPKHSTNDDVDGGDDYVVMERMVENYKTAQYKIQGGKSHKEQI